MPMILRMALGGVVGAAIGFGVYYFIGCRTGTCPLTGNPYVAMILWALMGVMVTAGR